jgi:succinyl-diaminopimelate desuccinylase
MYLAERELFSLIEKSRDEMVRTLVDLIRIPAIAPENGGEGELEKAERLVEKLRAFGLDRVERYDAEDSRVRSGVRPNVVVHLDGKISTEKLWIVTHLDIVPPGEESLWTLTKPFEPTVRDGRVYGRGSEDNMQSMISSIFAVKALKDLGLKPRRTVALGFVADEEQGSKYGIQHLIKQGLFESKDLIIVPDSGREDGGFIEIAEKSLFWFRVHTVGKQAHASRPGTGLNAHRAGMLFAVALDKMLHEEYSEKDEYFDPPETTIEPTKKDANVDAINIIPGEDVTYFDCRVLPRYGLQGFVDDIEKLAKEYQGRTGATIKIESIQKTVAPKPTDPHARIVDMLREAVKNVRKIDPKVGGIGGGTCAHYFRNAGLPAVVWSTIDEVAHQPNEYAWIDNIVNDAKVYAYLAVM